ncbi:MAG: hypothetical protein WCI97_06005 [Bacteroidota bacterium]
MKKWCLLSLVILTACVKDRTTLPHYNPVYTSPLRINEFAASTTGTSSLMSSGWQVTGLRFIIQVMTR